MSNHDVKVVDLDFFIDRAHLNGNVKRRNEIQVRYNESKIAPINPCPAEPVFILL